ncbi:MAG: preprotein translocase subunit SecG [Flavobacteriaceae bacterium]|nr:preprotein translocase subunit SecG [Flavobacteriaceae bacterium]MAS30125.1 preprotein translocase subunit SecG [Flavobacteriaceae bacterium]OUW37949.1 MAG: preprotein translocase subunit SecG [Flavobacteriaceae bacterium TMED184]|tara:strand:- start:2307 stop:2654 length:348 start_codon:yes stop_codon:yes gene_type:complete
MNTSFTIFVGLIILVCFLLVLVVMVQNPKGGGLSSSFGGSSQQLGGVQKTSDFLDKSTWILAVFLLVLILLSNISLNQNSQGLESRLINENNIEESTMESIPEVLPEIPEETIDQ